MYNVHGCSFLNSKMFRVKYIGFYNLDSHKPIGDMETPQHGNASKKQNHKTNLMSSSLNLKFKRLYSNDFHSHGRSARPPSLF